MSITTERNWTAVICDKRDLFVCDNLLAAEQRTRHHPWCRGIAQLGRGLQEDCLCETVHGCAPVAWETESKYPTNGMLCTTGVQVYERLGDGKV